MSGTISTPVVEVSKIQLRRGPAEDLPGAPVTGNPTQPTTPLDDGEVAFTTDTGQVFIGPDLTQGGPTLNRYAFPYQNIEVLTENSLSFLSSLFDYYYRDAQTGFYVSQQLDITTNSGDWQTLLINCTGGGAMPCIVSATANLACAQINYYLYDTGTIARTGKMSCVYIGNANAPILDDEYTMYPRVDLSSQNALDPTLVYGSIQFRAVPIADGSGQNVVIEYLNSSSSTPTMYLKLERGAAERGSTICNSQEETSSNPYTTTFSYQIGNTPVLMDNWGISTMTGGIVQYYVLATSNSPATGSQVSILNVGSDGSSVNYTDDAMYFNTVSGTPNILDYTVSISNGVISLSANTIATGAVATVTLIKFPVYLVQS